MRRCVARHAVAAAAATAAAVTVTLAVVTKQSYLDVSASTPSVARFYGTLDITTLGGAGFASQRTVRTPDNSSLWDLCGYDGLQLEVDQIDG